MSCVQEGKFLQLMKFSRGFIATVGVNFLNVLFYTTIVSYVQGNFQ